MSTYIEFLLSLSYLSSILISLILGKILRALCQRELNLFDLLLFDKLH